MTQSSDPDLRLADPDLKEELLDQLAGQVKHSPVPVILSMALVAYLASQHVSPYIWGGWLAVVVLLQGVRVVTLGALPRRRDVPISVRMNAAVALNATNTLWHSLSLLWFPLFTPYQAALQSMLFTGMGVAAIITTAGYRPFTRAHIWLGLTPMFALWAWSGLYGAGGAAAVAIAIIGFGYSATLSRISGRVYALYRESFETRCKLEEALLQAEAAGRAKTRFLASASHDLRQPIHALSLFSAALGMRITDDRSRHIVDNIEAAVQALTLQLDALLDVSKLDAGIVEVRSSHFSLTDLLSRLNEELLPLAENQDIVLSLQCPGDAYVQTDAALLERIVRNLLSNAINHNTGCEVLVQARATGSDWELRIADTGRGIPESEQQRVFEEFYQLENPERDRSKGLGLGLAIVQRLAQLLNLNMEFDSASGRGTQFMFTVPGKSVGESTEVPSKASDLQLPELTVLVVDDEHAVREGMRELLETLGCRVSTADGSSTAISAAAAEEPDIALVDFRLRSFDNGLKTIDQLRRIYPQLPAIIISGDTAPERLREASNAGIPVLSKPVLIEPLKEAIAQSCHLVE
ncbi:MAG: hybrid sensor histidine kinase/response regulator [Pseudomonadota bacterium]